MTVRLLDEQDWRDYRAIRLAALEESPAAFLSTFEEESQLEEADWRAAMVRARRLLAERDQTPLGVVSVGRADDVKKLADVFGLWVAPAARNTGVSWRLVEAAADLAANDGCSFLNYWVSTENGRAIAFASNFGFRVTSRRRTARVPSEEFGDQEICLALPLSDADSEGVPNPTGPRLMSKPGPR